MCCRNRFSMQAWEYSSFLQWKSWRWEESQIVCWFSMFLLVWTQHHEVAWFHSWRTQSLQCTGLDASRLLPGYLTEWWRSLPNLQDDCSQQQQQEILLVLEIYAKNCSGRRSSMDPVLPRSSSRTVARKTLSAKCNWLVIQRLGIFAFVCRSTNCGCLYCFAPCLDCCVATVSVIHAAHCSFHPSASLTDLGICLSTASSSGFNAPLKCLNAINKKQLWSMDDKKWSTKVTVRQTSIMNKDDKQDFSRLGFRRLLEREPQTPFGLPSHMMSYDNWNFILFLWYSIFFEHCAFSKSRYYELVYYICIFRFLEYGPQAITLQWTFIENGCATLRPSDFNPFSFRWLNYCA